MDRKSFLTLVTAMIMAGATPVLAGEREVAPETSPTATAAETEAVVTGGVGSSGCR